jgi:hypothetical protein
MRHKDHLIRWGLAATIVTVSGACGDVSKPDSRITSPVTVQRAGATINRSAPHRGAASLKELKDRNPARWVGDTVQSVLRGYRADYVARRRGKLPVKGLCEGFSEYFTARNAWGRSLAVTGNQSDILVPKCALSAKKIRFFSASAPPPEGEAYVTDRSMALLDSLQQITARVDEADMPAAQAVATLVSEIDRIETLAANASLTDQEYELVQTTIAGLIGTIAEAETMIPAILRDVAGSVDECAQRLGYVPDDPTECDQEVYEMFGAMSVQLPRPVLMCAIAMKTPSPIGAAPKVCDGHQIIEGMARGFIGGAVGGAWAGLVGTGGLGVPLTALLGGIGGAISGLAVGLAQTIWCETTK